MTSLVPIQEDPVLQQVAKQTKKKKRKRGLEDDSEQQPKKKTKKGKKQKVQAAAPCPTQVTPVEPKKKLKKKKKKSAAPELTPTPVTPPAQQTDTKKKKKKKEKPSSQPVDHPTAEQPSQPQGDPKIGFNDWSKASFKGNHDQKDKFLSLMGAKKSKKETAGSNGTTPATAKPAVKTVIPSGDSTPKTATAIQPLPQSTWALQSVGENKPLFVQPTTEDSTYKVTLPGVQRKIQIILPGQRIDPQPAESTLDEDKHDKIIEELTKQHNVARNKNFKHGQIQRGIGFGVVEAPTHELFSKNPEANKGKKITFDDDD